MRQRGRGSPWIAIGLLAGGLSGCALLDRLLGGREPPRPLLTPPADDHGRLPWAEQEEYFVVVRKSCRTLDVYHHGVRLESFPAVFGAAGTLAGKLYEGDLRTPTGLYQIVGKRPHPRWRRFLLLDYPNLQDRHRYAQAMDEGRIPRRGHRHAGVGGAIGIHGTDRPELNARDEDWTLGCISIANPDVERLADLVPVGTLVLIED
jgi:murein L,D-transpeptidase YafK